MFDLIVVGGNMAGAATAIKSAEMGIKIAIVEKNEEPFSPAHCAEGIAGVTAKFLDLDGMNCYRNEIKKFKIEILAKEYSFRLRHKGFVIDRNCVEKKLLDRARRNGAKFILGNRIINFESPNKIYLEKGKIKGKVIIDASGIACIIGRKIGMDTRLKPQDIGICIQSRVLSNFERETIKNKVS